MATGATGSARGQTPWLKGSDPILRLATGRRGDLPISSRIFLEFGAGSGNGVRPLQRRGL